MPLTGHVFPDALLCPPRVGEWRRLRPLEREVDRGPDKAVVLHSQVERSDEIALLPARVGYGMERVSVPCLTDSAGSRPMGHLQWYSPAPQSRSPLVGISGTALLGHQLQSCPLNPTSAAGPYASSEVGEPAGFIVGPNPAV